MSGIRLSIGEELECEQAEEKTRKGKERKGKENKEQKRKGEKKTEGEFRWSSLCIVG